MKQQGITKPQWRPGHVALALGLGIGVAVVMTTPAFAQSGSGGGDIQSVLQAIVNYINGTTAKLLATLAVIGIGIAWMFGMMDLRKAAGVVIGMGLVFGAASLVSTFTGGS